MLYQKINQDKMFHSFLFPHLAILLFTGVLMNLPDFM